MDDRAVRRQSETEWTRWKETFIEKQSARARERERQRGTKAGGQREACFFAA